MCWRSSWSNTYHDFGFDRLDGWNYCSKSRNSDPCNKIRVRDHGDINTARERPRFVQWDMSLEPAYIERQPHIRLSRSRVHLVEDKPSPRRSDPKFIKVEYIELAEPRRPPEPRPSPRRSSPDDNIPPPPPAPSPGLVFEGEVPRPGIRAHRRQTVVHSPPPPLRRHPSPAARSPSPAIFQEFETFRLRQHDRRDPEKANRYRAREADGQDRRSRNHHRPRDQYRDGRVVAPAGPERSGRRRRESYSRGADIAAPTFRRADDYVDRGGLYPPREAHVPETSRGREQQLFRNTRPGPPDRYLNPYEARVQSHERRRPPRDNGADVLQAAQEDRWRR